VFLHLVAGPLQACTPQHTVADAAQIMLQSGAEAVAVAGPDAQLVGVVTPRALLAWLAGGGGAERAVADLGLAVPPALSPDASIADGAIAIGNSPAAALAMTADGTEAGRLLALVTPKDLAPVFGDAPAAILDGIGRARDTAGLRALNQRARACALQYLTSPAATGWVGRFTESVDRRILQRLIALTATGDAAPACWCVAGALGRGESIPRRAPLLTVMTGGTDEEAVLEHYRRVADALADCDYLPASTVPLPVQTSMVADTAEWTRRYRAWIASPVAEQMARHRMLFDLRLLHGRPALWRQVRDAVVSAIDRDIIRVLAHDCLANLPPLTFYRDAVIEQGGGQTGQFRLEHGALAPLVDLGRVFAMAAREVMGTSTLERLAIARRLLPDHEAIFRDASETLRIVLWQQGRVAISQGTDGAELPPSLLSRHDRHMLKSGFPVIHRLLEFSADGAWLDAVR
jgi:CBS domain-containing protein